MALPTSTNNVTTRKLAATIQKLWAEKIDPEKADKVAQATSGNFASLDGNGNLADSHTKASDFATSEQGGKADTAVQSVKMGSSSGTELKNGTNVVIPNAVATGTEGATSGLMTAADKKKLNEIQADAQANQNAFSNVVVGSTTIAADTTTDTLTLTQGSHITLTPSSADDSVTIATDLSSKSAAQGGTAESLVTTGEKYTWNSKQDTIVFYDTYNASSNKAATKKTVDDAIGALDVSNITTNLGVSKTITALSETDGKISATASAIQIAESQVTNLVSDLAAKAPLASPALTGTPTAPTATTGTNTTQIATTAFVIAEINDRLGGADALVYKGTITLGTTTPGAFTPAADKGWTYKVVANGSTKRGYIDGVAVEVGDMLICNTDSTAAATSSNYATIATKWDFIQTNLDGVVTGPASSTSASVAGFADTSGKVIKQLTAAEIKSAAGLDLVKNQAITVTTSSVSDGTNTFSKYEHPTTSATNAAAVKVGKDSLGHVVIGDALTKGDVGLGSVVNTGDSATPVSGGTTKFTTGGAYTELNKKVDKEDGKGLSTNDYTTAEKEKLAGIASGAEVNQNAFSNIKVGSTTVTADTKTDTVEFVGSGHVTITGDATNDKVTIQTDLSSKSAASGGTDVSLVTTGEKYTWNSKAAGNHTHTTSLAANSDTGTVVSLSANTQYKLTAGGTSILFKTPADTGDTKVTQTKLGGTETSTYPVLLAPTGQTATATTTSNFSTSATYKPSTNTMSVNISGDAATASAAKSGSALETAINGKASTSHTHSVKINGNAKTIPASGGTAVDLGTYAENAFKTIAVANQTSVVADSATDTLTLAAGGATTITLDATNDKITISSADTKVTAVGNHYAPAEDSSAAISASGGSATQLPTSSSTTVQVVTGLKRDAKGHVVGVTSAALWSPNSTYSNKSLGQGYSATTSISNSAITVTMAEYALSPNGIVSIKFGADVPASATLNINGKGAKNVYYRGSAITANIIQAGDTATFMYDGTQYHLLCVDRSAGEMTDQEVTDIINALT